MTSGLLGKALLTTDVGQDIYTVPANTIATININVCNHSATPNQVSLLIRTGVSNTNSDYIEYLVPIPKNGVLERSGLVMSAGETIYVLATANASVRVHGFEENQ